MTNADEEKAQGAGRHSVTGTKPTLQLQNAEWSQGRGRWRGRHTPLCSLPSQQLCMDLAGHRSRRVPGRHSPCLKDPLPCKPSLEDTVVLRPPPDIPLSSTRVLAQCPSLTFPGPHGWVPISQVAFLVKFLQTEPKGTEDLCQIEMVLLRIS